VVKKLKEVIKIQRLTLNVRYQPSSEQHHTRQPPFLTIVSSNEEPYKDSTCTCLATQTSLDDAQLTSDKKKTIYLHLTKTQSFLINHRFHYFLDTSNSHQPLEHLVAMEEVLQQVPTKK